MPVLTGPRSNNASSKPMLPCPHKPKTHGTFFSVIDDDLAGAR